MSSSTLPKLLPYALFLSVAPFWVATGPHLYDGGELVAAGIELGASHPPGQPAHALLSRAAAFLPLGPLAFRSALISAVAASLAGWRIALWVDRLLPSPLPPATRLLAPHLAAFAVLLSEPVARQTTRVEVYAPALFCTLMAFAALTAPRGESRGRLWRVGLWAGLAAAFHPPHGAVALLAGVIVLAREGGDWRRSVGLPLGFGVGSLPYVLLPLREMAGARTWGHPDTLNGLFEYLTAEAYRQNLGPASGSFLDVAVSVMWHGLTWAGPMAVVGALATFLPPKGRVRPTSGQRWVLALLPVAFLAPMLQTVEARNPDNVAYAAPAVSLLCIAGVLGIAARTRRHPRLFALAAALLAMHPTARGAQLEWLRAEIPALQSVAWSLTAHPPPRALVVLETDFAAGAYMQARIEEQARPDTGLLVTGLATSSWHWEDLANHPAFDGRPIRYPGEPPKRAYPMGAVETALRSGVSVASEPAWTVGGRGEIRGPLLIVARPPPPESGLGDGLFRHALRQGRERPLGDYDAAGAILRQMTADRVTRFLGRNRPPEAGRDLFLALHWVPAELRRPLLSLPPSLVRPPAPWVRDRGAFMVSANELARLAAVVLHASGEGQAAAGLLEDRFTKRDARALLQRAALLAADGERARALELLGAYGSVEGEEEAEAWKARLDL